MLNAPERMSFMQGTRRVLMVLPAQASRIAERFRGSASFCVMMACVACFSLAMSGSFWMSL